MKKKMLMAITGSISASSAHDYLIYLKQFFEVTVIMTENAKKMINKNVLSYYADNIYDTLFYEKEIPHILLSSKADFFIVLPASANIISKVCCGIADDLVTSTILAYKKEIMFFPNMNKNMWLNPILQENVTKLEKFGHIFLLFLYVYIDIRRNERYYY
ncbi:flavoprotein [Helcococcus ovis]|uniref:Flavoprotein n=1 Tax=Helcococcus ovis TaxID=72026 RepID=A0A4R9C486_9FIRM|nr:flavoprotein [Helcococcus ovis]TFF65892.1 flavoprotein [Helcococcus ovis]TFF67355.1 flavoprotein [Helcococcus ovis]